MRDLNLDYFKFLYNKVAPAQGRILISEPFFSDIYFQRSVVLLTEFSRKGAIGFILNKPVDMKVTEVLPDFPGTNATLSLGGPVSTNTIHYIHTYGSIIPKSIEVLEGIFWGGEYDYLQRIIESEGYNSARLRFFLGYSGWASGQLEEELKANAWQVSEIPPAKIMNANTHNLWKESLNRLGENFSFWTNSPANPSLN